MTRMLILCSRNAHDQNVLVRRAQRIRHACHSPRGKASELGRNERDRLRASCVRPMRSLRGPSLDAQRTANLFA